MNRPSRSLAAAPGLLLILVATAACADPLDANAVTDAARSRPLTDVAASEVDVSASASKGSASSGDDPIAQGDDAGVLLGQLITQYLDSYQ